MVVRLLRLAPVAVVLCLLCLVLAQNSKIDNAERDVGSLSTQEIEEQLQVHTAKNPVIREYTDHQI